MQPMAVAGDVPPAERNLRLALRIIGLANCLLLIFLVYGDRFLLGGKGGYAWSPDHYEEHGNTTLEFEGMILFTYFGLGVSLIQASFDPNLDNATWLIHFCIIGAFGGHAIAMLIAALWDFEREWGHLMPYGDVSVLLICAGVLYYLNRKYQLKID
jgi:hypothetical protein